MLLIAAVGFYRFFLGGQLLTSKRSSLDPTTSISEIMFLIASVAFYRFLLFGGHLLATWRSSLDPATSLSEIMLLIAIVAFYGFVLGGACEKFSVPPGAPVICFAAPGAITS